MIGNAVRVLIDTNVLISYLWPSSRPGGTIDTVVEAALSGAFTWLAPEVLIAEMFTTITTKTYIAHRIGAEQAQRFVNAIHAIAEILPPIQEPIPKLVRDPKDDYLLAYALVGQADYLVTGDDDLLALGAVDRLRIISPAAFANELTRR